MQNNNNQGVQRLITAISGFKENYEHLLRANKLIVLYSFKIILKSKITEHNNENTLLLYMYFFSCCQLQQQ